MSQPITDPNNREANQWSMFLHFSILMGYFLPVIGCIAPIIIWQIKKWDYAIIDAHGKVVANWLLSVLVYVIICMILKIILIGYIGLALLPIITLVYAVIGGIKANDGKVWEYPLSIRFIK